MLYFTDFRN